MAKLKGEAGSAEPAAGASGWGAHRFRFGELWERRRARHRSRGGSPLLRLGLLLVAGLLLLAWLVLDGAGR